MDFSNNADILVTNNPLVEERFRGRLPVEYQDTPLLEVLIRARDHIHSGRRLLTHPLSGSVKPNETPYKSVLISGAGGTTDMQSIHIIEECIQAVRRFAPKHISEQHLPDLQAIDLSLIRPAIDQHLGTTQ